MCKEERKCTSLFLNDPDDGLVFKVPPDNAGATSRGLNDRIKGYDVCVVPDEVEDASPPYVCVGHEPRIASVPSAQDGHVHPGHTVHPTTTGDHGRQSHGIFDPSHRCVP